MNKMELIKTVEASQRKSSLPDLRSGDTVRVHYKIREAGKERVQVFEGLVIATKKMNTLQASITVRKVSLGVGVERTFPLHSPWITKLERVKRSRVRRAKLYFVRRLVSSAKRLRFKDKHGKPEVWEDVVPEVATDSSKEESPVESENIETETELVKQGSEESAAPTVTLNTDDKSITDAGSVGGEPSQSVSSEQEEAKDTGA